MAHNFFSQNFETRVKTSPVVNGRAIANPEAVKFYGLSFQEAVKFLWPEAKVTRFHYQDLLSGFHITIGTFTASIQWGPGNRASFGVFDGWRRAVLAEIAGWVDDGEGESSWIPFPNDDHVWGYVHPLEALNWIASIVEMVSQENE